MTEIFNLHTLCRCCHRDGSFKSLQLSYAYNNCIEVYSTMLKETLDVTINPPPFEASYAICDYCIQKLRNAASFKQQVLECEQKFEEYCKNELASIIIKEEINYGSSIGDSSDIEDKNSEICENIVEEHMCQNVETEDEKCNVVKSVEVPGNTDDGSDEKCHINVKNEDNKGALLGPIQETLPCEYVGTDEEKGTVYEKTPKSNGVKGTKRNVGHELELCVKTKDGKIYTCKTCDKKYKLLKMLRKHILMQHKDAYKCQICFLQCTSGIQYTRHIKTHATKIFKCQFCGKSFNSKSSLKLHINIHTKTKPFQCDICHKFFAYKQTLKKHLLWHSGANKTCICDICGRGFNDKTNLNYHIRGVHDKLKPFKCNFCAKAFKAKKTLKEHMFFHTGEKPFKCDMCIDEFVSSWKLRSHKLKYHLGRPASHLTTKFYTCKICKLNCNTRSKFLIHLKTHAGHKEYKCHLCSKDFSCKYSLNRHINEHSGIKAYACDMCDKKYKQQSQLWRHKKKVHDPTSRLYMDPNIERVKCDLCNKSFKNIEKHMKAHKTRPYTCEFCLKSYPERGTLNRHILIVHQGIRRHPCTLCDKKYTKSTGLQIHTRKVHKLELKREVEGA